jgi:hypothetical protein
VTEDEFNPGLVASIAAGITLTDEQKRMGLTPEKMALGVLRLQARPDLVAQLDAIVDKRYAAQPVLPVTGETDEFVVDLRAAPGSYMAEEVIAGLARIAKAAGIYEQLLPVPSFNQLCDALADWCRARRDAAPGRPGALAEAVEESKLGFGDDGVLTRFGARFSRGARQHG